MKPFRSKLALHTVLAALGGAAACDPAPEPPTVEASARAQLAVQRTRGLVGRAGKAVEVTMTGDTKLGAAVAALADDPAIARLLREVTSEGAAAPAGRAPQTDGGASPEGPGAQAEAIVRDRLLAPGNLESDRPAETVYLLRPDPTCRSPARGPAPEAPSVDADCARVLDRLELRVALTSVGDELYARVLVGPRRHELSVLRLQPSGVEWQADLAAAKRAFDHVRERLGDDVVPSLGALTTARGRLRAALRVDDETTTARIAVLEPIEVRSTAPFSVTLGRSEITAAIDERTGDGRLAWRLGAVDVRLPWAGSDPARAELEIVAAGSAGEIAASEREQRLTVRTLAIPAASMRVQGRPVFGLALGAGAGRPLSGAVRFDDPDRLRIELASPLDLQIGVHLGAIFDAVDEPPPPHLRDERYRLTLEGPRPALEIFEPGRGDAQGDLRLRLSSGALRLDARNAARTWTLAAGACAALVAPPPGGHPIVDALAPVACE
jgi:hypothetical protein